jgi:beta-lactamase regulating signal transducer with metallopeptidase domain
MNAILHSLPSLARWPIELLLASSICLSLAWSAAWLLRRRSAALRANLWLVAYLSIAALVTARFAGYTIPLPILRAPVEQAGVVAREIAAVSNEHRRAPESRAPSVSVTPAQLLPAPTITPLPRRHFDWRLCLGAVWLFGVGLGLLRILAGSWALQRCLRSAGPPAPGSSFEQALAVATTQLEPNIGARGLRSRVLLHPEAGSPMSFGLRTWWIVFPGQAVEWSPERLRLVLAHELAHGVRRDHLALLLVRCLTAFCWLNPLGWFGLRRFRLLCENAADDQALVGQEPASYVRELLQLVSELRNAPRLWSSAALSIGQRSSLEQRVQALLDETIARRRVSMRMFLALLTGACALALVLPSLRAVAAEKTGTSSPAQGSSAAMPKPVESLKTRTLTVFVRDEEGRPVAGAKVAPRGLRATLDHSSWYGWNPSIPKPAVLTDAAGHATFAYPSRVYEDLVTSTVDAWVSHPDFCDHRVELDVAHPEPIILKLGARVNVTALLPNATPAGGKTFVQLASDRGYGDGDYVQWRTEPTRGTATGQVPPGSYQLRAVVLDDDGGSSFSEPVHLDARAGERKDFGLTVKPGGTIAGLLSANVPTPVRNGKVMVYITTPIDDARRELIRKATTDLAGRPLGDVGWETFAAIEADGTFKLAGVPTGEITVCALCDRFVSTDPTGPQKSSFTKPQRFPAAQAGALVVAMEKAGEARVRVLTPQRAPLAGAKVVFSPNQSLGEGNGTFGGAYDSGEILKRWQGEGDKEEMPQQNPPSWQAETDGSGLAIVSNLPQGLQDFYVFTDAFEMPIVASNGRADRRGNIAIKPGETSSITVKLEVKGTTSLSEQLALTPRPSVDFSHITGGWLALTPGPDLEGQVVDEGGTPLAGVLVDAWSYCPGNETKTDHEGKFRLKEPNDFGRNIEVQFSLAGYSPFHVTRQPVGRLLERVVLSNWPYFEGVVRDTKGAPLAGQLIRACTGEKEADGVSIQHVWSETRSDEHGRYLLRVFPDTYEFQVRSAANEITKVSGQKIVRNETRKLDLTLTPGLTFRARIIDTETRQPLAGVRLYHDEHPGLEGTSDAEGRIVISGMLPGDFQFEVDAEKAGYRRWWSAQAKGDYQRKTLEADNWQRNFDHLDFEIAQTAEPVEIELERGVHIRGTVRNPSGQPVEGATVSPVRSGRSTTVTGDSRFSVRSKKDGRYEILLPATGMVEYNLMAHDGAHGKWREFANGILPPIKTKPGEVRENVDLTVSLPCVVRGRVVDQDGQPVTGREVRAASSDMLEGGLSNPTTRVAADGTFELRFVRAGRQRIQVSPFWLLPTEAPSGTSLEVTAAPDVPVTGVILTAKPLEPRSVTHAMKTPISITELATALSTPTANNQPVADTSPLQYELKVTPEIKKAFRGSDSIEIRQITGTVPKFEVGGTYRVTGVCRQQSLKRAALYVGNTAEAGPDAIVAAPGSSLSKSLLDAHTEFDFTFTVLRPGILHLTVYDVDQQDKRDNASAGVYLGDVALKH